MSIFEIISTYFGREHTKYENNTTKIQSKNLTGLENGAWITSMVIGKSHNIDKETFIDKMSKIDIPVRQFFYPLSMLPPFDIKENEIKNPISYDVSNRGVNLPGSAKLTDDDMKFICDGIKKVLV